MNILQEIHSMREMIRERNRDAETAQVVLQNPINKGLSSNN